MARVLYYKEGVVKITDQGLRETPFIDMYKSDRTKDKRKFHDAITFLYFMYSRESIFRNRMPYQRKIAILTDRLQQDADYYDKKLLKTEGFKECEEFYKKDQLSESEWAYEMWKEDVEQYITYLRAIPYTIKTKQKKDGVLVDVEQDNSSVKMPAVKHYKELIQLEAEIKKKISEEKKSKTQGKREKKMFEDPE